jgi:hypothetical protein
MTLFRISPTQNPTKVPVPLSIFRFSEFEGSPMDQPMPIFEYEDRDWDYVFAWSFRLLSENARRVFGAMNPSIVFHAATLWLADESRTYYCPEILEAEDGLDFRLYAPGSRGHLVIRADFVPSHDVFRLANPGGHLYCATERGAQAIIAAKLTGIMLCPIDVAGGEPVKHQEPSYPAPTDVEYDEPEPPITSSPLERLRHWLGVTLGRPAKRIEEVGRFIFPHVSEGIVPLSLMRYHYRRSDSNRAVVGPTVWGLHGHDPYGDEDLNRIPEEAYLLAYIGVRHIDQQYDLYGYDTSEIPGDRDEQGADYIQSNLALGFTDMVVARCYRLSGAQRVWEWSANYQGQQVLGAGYPGHQRWHLARSPCRELPAGYYFIGQALLAPGQSLTRISSPT